MSRLTVQQGDTTGKLERVEQAQSNTHRALSSKLDGHSQELQYLAGKIIEVWNDIRLGWSGRRC